MAMTVGELVATFDLDDSGAAAGITRAELAVAGLRRDINGTLRNTQGDVIRQSAQIGQAIGAGIRTNLDASLADLHPQIAVDADSRPADADVARLVDRIRLLSATIDVDAPVEGVDREITEIRAGLQSLVDSHPDIAIQTNAADALVTLETARRAVADLDHARANIHIDSNAPSAIAALAAVRHEEDALGESGGASQAATGMGQLASTIGGVASQAGMMAGSFGSIVPAVAGLIGALVNMVPAASVAATALLAVAQAGAALKIGSAGIGSALKAAFSTTASSAGAAANSAQKLADAQRAVRDATAQAAVANAAAARTVTSAERALTDAQIQATQAQKALNAARVQAARDLQDQNNNLIDAQQAQRQAVLDVQDALAQLNADRMKGGAVTAEQIQKDQLAYDQAQQHLKEQGITVQRLQSDTAAANKAGVNGSAAVVSAQSQVAKSQQNIRDQVQAVQLAQQAMARTAAQGLESIQKAQEALKQSMVSSAGAANALASAMSKLAPSAQAFVREVIALKPAWHSLQLDVQQRLFLGLAGALASTATSVLPVLRANLVSSAGAMNAMGLGVLSAARNLASSGVLGQAMGSASAGLHNLVGIPGLVVTAFGQLAAAAGPTFQKLTASVASGAASIGASLGKAFASGGLQTAISDAVSLIKELISVGANVGSILMSVFKATSASGGSFLDVLKTISSTLAKAFASPAVQSALKALFGVMNSLATQAAPLLMSALGVIAPVLTALGPPVQAVIAALGQGLAPIITALGPVLLTAAQSFGQLLGVWAPLLPMAGTLIALLGPILTPILAAMGTYWRQITPLVLALGQAIMTTLAPILSALPSIIAPLMTVFTTLTGAVLPILTQLVVALSPSLGILAGTFAALLVAVAPLIQQLAVLIGRGLSVLVPVITPVIGIIGKLATILSGTLAKYITGVIIPAIMALTALLQGHFSQALGYVRQAVSGWISFLASIFVALPARIVAWMQPAITWMRNLPSMLLHALGDLGSLLLGAGGSIVKGFIHGIEQGFDDVKNTLSNLTSLLPSWKGPPAVDAKILTANGALVLRSFMAGIDNEKPNLHRQLAGLTDSLPGLTPGLLGRSGSVGGNVARSGGSAASAAPIHVHVSIGGKDMGEAVLDPIRKTIRNLGGNVQAALGVHGRG
ncbi:phage-related protein [Streptomyces sp. 846.5]|nr:hypothetical protein [Streptomyces sp. 846.5]TDT95330.1 phage-related protein [Streptomyces sp. 846.5]